MSKASELRRKARDVRVMAENAGSEGMSHRLRQMAHRLESAAEHAAREDEGRPLRREQD